MTRSREEKHFRLSVSFTRVSDSRPVVFKADGHRFATPFTVKFNQDEAYHVLVVLKPAISIRSVFLHDQKIQLEVFSVTRPDPETGAYVGLWQPELFPVTHSNHREQVKLAIIFENSGVFMTDLQSKFYPKEEVNHCSWGEVMHAVQYACSISKDNLVTIHKTELH